MSVPTRSPYVFSKYALRGFSDVLRYEMEGFGVKVSKLPYHILNAGSEKRDKCGSMLWRMTQIGNFFIRTFLRTLYCTFLEKYKMLPLFHRLAKSSREIILPGQKS